MFPIQDKISVASRSNLESQLAIFSTMTHKTFEGYEKLFSLNLNAAKASLEESAVAVKQLLSAKDAQEFFTLSSAQAQPTIEKALAYSRHLSNIASSTQAELSKATEAQIDEVNRRVSKLVDDAAKNAPAGSESVLQLVKSSMESAAKNYAQMTRTSKQAMAALEANVNAGMNHLAAAR